jgi:hypothetical protein
VKNKTESQVPMAAPALRKRRSGQTSPAESRSSCQLAMLRSATSHFESSALSRALSRGVSRAHAVPQATLSLACTFPGGNISPGREVGGHSILSAHSFFRAAKRPSLTHALWFGPDLAGVIR